MAKQKEAADMEISELSEFLESAGGEIAAAEQRLADLRANVKSYAAALNRKVSKLTGVIESSNSGGSGNGKRTRASAEEVEERKSGVLSALKGTDKGKGKGIGAIAETMGLDIKYVRQALGKLKAEKKVKQEGDKAGATYFAS